MAGRIVKKCEESIEKPDFWPHREYCNLCRGRDKDCEVVRRGICNYSEIVEAVQGVFQFYFLWFWVDCVCE